MLRLKKQALTFDDVLLVPAYSNVLPSETSLKTQLTSTISLNVPMLSAAMDTVTDSRLAIAMAQEGGIGFIHKNMSIDKQAQHVSKVKKFEAGMVQQPVTVKQSMTMAQVHALIESYGFASFPVVDDGNYLIGLLTRRDIRFVQDSSVQVSDVMTTKDDLVTVKEGAEQSEIMALMQRHRVEKVLVVNDKFQLSGLITVKDFEKSERKPNACKDNLGRLRVGAAVGTSSDTLQRVSALVEAGVDVVLVDSSHGHSQGVLRCIQDIRARYPKLAIIGGNVATAEGALALVEAGVSAVKVGIGPGSICTTRIVTGVGVPQISAIADVCEAVSAFDIPVIADGGIRFSGDIAKALAAGASCVMVGSMFAGTKEAPGETVLYQGRSYKLYRGMGSLGAMAQGSKDRYFQSNSQSDKLVPEGIEGRVPYKGRLEDVIHQNMGGLRSCLGLTGCSTIEALRTTAEFVQITSAGMGESHVHDVSITKEAPNYHSMAAKY